MSTQDLAFSGAETVRQWFGSWPEFHDAEIISLTLCRLGESVLRVYPYAPEKPATVEFWLSEITDLEIADFSHQNVIFSLSIEQVTNENGEAVFRLTMLPCFGLSGRIDAKRLRVNHIPGKSCDGGSQW